VSKAALPVRILLPLALVAVVGCSLAATSTPTPSPSPTIDPLEAAVDRSLAAMSDSQKVGQLIMAGYSGADAVKG
jgi:hypothetical protein